MCGAERARSRACAALRMTALGIVALLLGAGGAKALPAVSFVLDPGSSVYTEALVMGGGDFDWVDLSGFVDTELFGILGPSPGLSFAGGTLDIGDMEFSMLPGGLFKLGLTHVQAVLSGGPVWGTPVGGPGFEGEFGLAGVTLTLNRGTVHSELGGSPLPPIDFSLNPVIFDLGASDRAWLSATAVGGGLYDYILGLEFQVVQTIVLSPTVELVLQLSTDESPVGRAQAVPEPGTAALVGLGLAALALARARRR